MLNINRKDTIETDNWIRVIFLLPPFNFGHNAFHNARIRRSYPILSGERVMVVGKFENIFREWRNFYSPFYGNITDSHNFARPIESQNNRNIPKCLSNLSGLSNNNNIITRIILSIPKHFFIKFERIYIIKIDVWKTRKREKIKEKRKKESDMDKRIKSYKLQSYR